MQSNAHPDIAPVDEAEHHARNEDGHHDHHEQKARAAARMVARLDAAVLHRQRQARLVAEDGLMLRAMVLEHALNVLLLRAQEQVAEEDQQLDDGLDQIVHDHVRDEAPEQAREEGRQDHKKPDGQAQRQHDRQRHDELLQLFAAELLLQPQIELRRLALLLGEEVRRVHQRLHAADHGVHKGHSAAQHGQAENGIAVADELQLLDLLDQPLLGADDDGLLFRSAHEDALNERLTADGGAEFGFCLVLLCHVGFSLQ